ncbi:MAG: shikimate dehydrogenase [Gallionella sp.]
MTDRYAVIGNPISHSKSPLIHKMFAEQTGQDMSYEAIEAPLDGFAVTLQRLINEGYKGCNVTVPFKFEAYELAKDYLGKAAQVARAVNTLQFQAGGIVLDLPVGKIYGNNTDGLGLVRDIEINFRVPLRDKRVLLMGAGGASYGVVLPLLNYGASVIVANRTAEKAVELAAKFPSKNIRGGSYAELTGQQFDVVINATSAGLNDSEIPLPTNIFAPGALAYDMMYGRETPFMKFAKAHGAQVADGLGMLVEQAAEAFAIWRDVRPDTVPVLAALRAAL